MSEPTAAAPPPTHAPGRRRGMPILGQAVPILGAFASMWLLYGRCAGIPVQPLSPAAGPLTSFLLLFLQLRLVDDLDDLGGDEPDPRRRRTRRGWLLLSLVAGVVALALLNRRQPDALATAGVATALAFGAPFGFKRMFPGGLAPGFVVFEAAPAAIFAYVYCAWRDVSAVSLPAGAVVPAVTLFWAGYEVWKFSRKLHTPAMQPYYLGPSALRGALSAFLVIILAAGVAVSIAARLSMMFATAFAAIPLTLLVWINMTWPGHAELSEGRVRQPIWRGLRLITAIELVLLWQLAPAMMFGK